MNKSDFLYASDAQTDEQTIVLTPGQLQMLIKQAIAPLVAEISDLKQRIAELENRLDIKHDLEHDIQREHEIEHDTQDHAALKTDTAEPSEHEIIPLPLQMPLVTRHDLESVKSELLNKIDEMYIDLQLDIASDRRRITALERPNYGEGARERVNELHRAMRQHHMSQVTFAQAAKLLGVTYQRACQLRGLIAIDPRFKIVKDPRHSQRMLIRLTYDVNR